MSIESEFKDKVVVITGAAGVYGKWLTEAFAEVDAKLSLSDIRLDKLEDLVKDLGLDSEKVVLHQTDLRDDVSMLELVSSTYDTFNQADILINNAGLYPGGFVLDMDLDMWDAIMDVNVRAPFVLAREFSKRMIQDKTAGNIINIGSAAARSMRTSMVPYCISKTALDRLTKGLSLELSPYNIRVNAVEPGFAQGSEVSPLTDEHVQSMSGRIPLVREAEREDIAAAIMYLCSSHASYVTGATLSVDGGVSAGSQVVYIDQKEAKLK